MYKKYYEYLRTSRIPEYQLSELPAIPKVIHGHVCASQFSNYFSNSIFTTIIRDPLKRSLSHWLHYHRLRGELKNVRWGTKLPIIPDISFREFAFLPELQNLQTERCSPLLLSDFYQVGVLDPPFGLDQFIRSFAEDFRKKLPLLNRTTNLIDIPPTIDTKFLDKFKEFHALDYRLYSNAIRLARSSTVALSR